MTRYLFHLFSIADSEFSIIQSYIDELNKNQERKNKISVKCFKNIDVIVILVYGVEDKQILNNFFRAFDNGISIRFYHTMTNAKKL